MRSQSTLVRQPFPSPSNLKHHPLKPKTNTSHPVERLTKIATEKLSQKVVLLRVGQLCGSTSTGHWNTSEMWPIMVATSFHPSMNCIPNFPGKMVDWIPVDVAASAVMDILLSSSAKEDGVSYSVNNIVNPRSITWEELVGMLQDVKINRGGRRMAEVSMSTWVARLAQLADEGVDANELPGLKLLQFFENMAEGGTEESKIFETAKSRETSQALRECLPFCTEWVAKNLKVWKESGFLH
jgi:thioester reductase-like protein